MSVTHVSLVLPYPISSNVYWRSRVIKAKGSGIPMAIVYVTPEAKAYKAEVARIARTQIGHLLGGRLRLSLQLYPHRPLDYKTRMRKFGELWDDTVQCIDLGNAEKVMSDALQGTVFADDCKYRKIEMERMEPDENGARLVIKVERILPRAEQATFIELASLSGPHQRVEVPAFADEGVDLSDGLPF